MQCCAEVRFILDSGPDGGDCPAVGACRGFEGNCGQIAEQFASLAVLPDYPNGMAEYTCHLFPGARPAKLPRDARVLVAVCFVCLRRSLLHAPVRPDEDKPVDSFIVGLISIAIALPVTLFLQSCFEIANDNEAPESWLEWVGWRKLVFGLHANRKWHYTGPLGQPVRHVKWFIRSVGAPSPETIINLWHSFVSAITGTPPPWTIEAREAAGEAAEEEAGNGGNGAVRPEGSEKAPSTTSSVRSARALARYKRIMAATGFIGTYICWAVFTWCVPCAHVCVLAWRCVSTNETTILIRRNPARSRRAGSSSCTACSSTSCWATRRRASSRAPGVRAVPHQPAVHHACVYGRSRTARHTISRPFLNLTARHLRCDRHLVRPQRRLRVALHPGGGGQGRNHPGHPGAPLHDAQLQLARGARRGSPCGAATVRLSIHARALMLIISLFSD